MMLLTAWGCAVSSIFGLSCADDDTHFISVWARFLGEVMSIAVTLSPKRLWLLIDALNARIAAEEERYRTEDSAEDADGDFGNDLHNLRLQRDEFVALQAEGGGTATDYQCWSDPADSSVSLIRFQDVHQCRDEGRLSDHAVMLYRFIAHTGEEAMAIHALRQGWPPYVPMGEYAPCPTCGAVYFPLGYGDCWRCGHIG
jgi:hypothetical protein